MHNSIHTCIVIQLTCTFYLLLGSTLRNQQAHLSLYTEHLLEGFSPKVALSS